MPPDESALPDFQYILRLVKRILPNGYDHEAIASELVSRGLLEPAAVSFTAIKRYCISELRKHRTELRANECYASRASSWGQGPDSNGFNSARLSDLLSNCDLNATQRTIIIRKFWLGESDNRIAWELSLPFYRVYELRTEAIEKLRLAARKEIEANGRDE